MNAEIKISLNAKTAAAYCGLSTSTLNKLRLKGDGPVFVKLGRRVIYRPDDLNRWMEINRRTSTSDTGGAYKDGGFNGATR